MDDLGITLATTESIHREDASWITDELKPTARFSMAGRRSHPRYTVATPWEGGMRILRDVVVDRTSADELLAVSQAPGVTGELMTLDLMGGGITLGFRVKVLESRPVIVAGAVRHRLRLGLMQPIPGARVRPRATAPANAETEVV